MHLWPPFLAALQKVSPQKLLTEAALARMLLGISMVQHLRSRRMVRASALQRRRCVGDAAHARAHPAAHVRRGVPLLTATALSPSHRALL